MRQKLTVVMVMVGLVLAGLPGLSWSKESPAESERGLTLAYAKFGFKLLGQLRGNKEENLFISPASVAIALAMTYNGAAADTRQAMAGTLEFQGLSLDQINQGNARLRQALRHPDPKVKLNLANSLWLQQGFTFKPEFLKNNEKFFGASLQVLNFTDPGAPGAINAWVAKATAGKITEIVKQVQPPLVIINAIYFKGTWTRPFNQALTRDRPFTLGNGRQKPVPMMSQSGKYQYWRGQKFQAVSLPYGEKGRFNMKIFLPDRNSSLSEFFRELNAANWEQWQGKFKLTPGSIVLPRYKLTYQASLAKALKALGMAVAFDERKANFSNLCPPPGVVYIDDVIHKTFVEVNEEGTEAAAITAVQMAMTARIVPPQETFTMVVDRPFFVAIDDSETGALLFLGAIVEPK